MALCMSNYVEMNAQDMELVSKAEDSDLSTLIKHLLIGLKTIEETKDAKEAKCQICHVVHKEKFEHFQCSHCQVKNICSHGDYRYKCTDCSHIFCKECFSKMCRTCCIYNYICKSCQTFCSDCSARICDDCAENCSKCNDLYCSHCIMKDGERRFCKPCIVQSIENFQQIINEHEKK